MVCISLVATEPISCAEKTLSISRAADYSGRFFFSCCSRKTFSDVTYAAEKDARKPIAELSGQLCDLIHIYICSYVRTNIYIYLYKCKYKNIRNLLKILLTY